MSPTQPDAAAGDESGGRPATLQQLLTSRQYQQKGLRAPHKPLLVILVLTRLLTTGTSALSWLEARRELAALIVEFGPTSKTSPTQAAAYPYPPALPRLLDDQKLAPFVLPATSMDVRSATLIVGGVPGAEIDARLSVDPSFDGRRHRNHGLHLRHRRAPHVANLTVGDPADVGRGTRPATRPAPRARMGSP